jgi:hypothetical protein
MGVYKMSTTQFVFDIDFKGRKPSRVQLLSKVKAAIQRGAAAITVTWGENWIELDYSFNARAWNGCGWLRDIGGDDIARELNQLQKRG